MKMTYIGDPRNANKRMIVRIKHKGVVVELKLFPREISTTKVMPIVDFLQGF